MLTELHEKLMSYYKGTISEKDFIEWAQSLIYLILEQQCKITLEMLQCYLLLHNLAFREPDVPITKQEIAFVLDVLSGKTSHQEYLFMSIPKKDRDLDQLECLYHIWLHWKDGQEDTTVFSSLNKAAHADTVAGLVWNHLIVLLAGLPLTSSEYCDEQSSLYVPEGHLTTEIVFSKIERLFEILLNESVFELSVQWNDGKACFLILT